VVCCSVCCSVLQCVVVCVCDVSSAHMRAMCQIVIAAAEGKCLWCVAVCVAVCFAVRVAACCSVLQCAAVCC